MYLNSVSVKVIGGSERTSGFVEIEHGTQYSISLRNDHDVRCNAEVNIDGKNIGTFRIAANSTIRLERKPDDNGRFTFYRLGSEEGTKSDLGSVSASDLGLLKVVFTPEVQPAVVRYTYAAPGTDQWRDPETGIYTNSVTCRGGLMTTTCSVDYSSSDSGGTGLSGHSDQTFFPARSMCLDYSQKTTIYLRLIEASKTNEPRPLTPVMNSSPIPPPVNGV